MNQSLRNRLCFVFMWVIAGPHLAGAVEPAPIDPQQIEAGRILYEDKCAQCHGIKGDGAGVASDRISPRPRDFTSGSFKIRTTPSGELPTDADLAAVIRRGMPYTTMPSWPSFGDEQIASLVAYIKTFNEDFTDPDMLVPPMEIPDPPPLSEESVRKGRDVFVASKCFTCHGDRGRGDGESSPTLADDAGRWIRSADLTQRWTFRGGARREDIYRTFTTGLDGTPMPSYADSISEEERWQLVDYVHSLSRDEPDYGSLAVASLVDGEITPDPSSEIFSGAQPTLFPMLGQVTDPGRSFAPAVNSLEVRAVYNAEFLAVQLSWHAMMAQREGSNRPDGRDPAPEGTVLSDAVAIQLPTELTGAGARPYLFYGDPDRSVDLWFYDAAKDAAEVYIGRGEANLAPRPQGQGPAVRARGVFEDGLWRVVFVAPRGVDEAESPLRFPERSFIPMAFSVWTGHAAETGNRRAISSWYHIYLAPQDTGGPYLAAGGMAFATLIAELLIAVRVRRTHKNPKPQ